MSLIKTKYLKFNDEENAFVEYIKSKHNDALNEEASNAIKNVLKRKVFKDYELAALLIRYDDCIKPELDKGRKCGNNIARIPISITVGGLERQKILFDAYDIVQINSIWPLEAGEDDRKTKPRLSRDPTPLFGKYNESTWNVKQVPASEKKSLFYLCMWLIERWYESFCEKVSELPSEIKTLKRGIKESRHCMLIRHSEAQTDEGFVDNPCVYTKTYSREETGLLTTEILTKEGNSYARAIVEGEPLNISNCHKLLTRLSLYKKARFSINGLVNSAQGWSLPCVLSQAAIVPATSSYLQNKEEFVRDIISTGVGVEEDDVDSDELYEGGW